MTTQPTLASAATTLSETATLGQVREEFLRSPAGRKLAADDASRLRRFVTWCGVSVTVDSVRPFKIEQFLEQQINTSNPPKTYMAVLRAFFAFAFERGLASEDLMKNVRAPRGSGTTRRAAAP